LPLPQDLELVSHDLKNTLLIDDSPHLAAQPDNLIQVNQFNGNPDDRELIQTANRLSSIIAAANSLCIPLVEAKKIADNNKSE